MSRQRRYRSLLSVCCAAGLAFVNDRVWSQNAAAPVVQLSFREVELPAAATVTTSTPGAYPINLPTALQLAGARPLDIAIASERIRVAAAELDRARVLWLPTLYLGGDYYRHDGQLQDVAGTVFGTSKSTLMGGAGASAVFAVSDAIFAPLAARQNLRARQANLQAAQNDVMLAAAEAYFNVQQAKGELAGALDAVRRSEDLVRRAEKLAPGLVPPLEVTRTRAELARRRQAAQLGQERWRVASAELVRVLRLDAGTLVEPIDPPNLLISLIDPNQSLDGLIALALTNRPELEAHQALVQATLERIKQEKLRPLVPSVLLRGASTNPGGTLGVGYFGGGRNDRVADFSARGDWDVQVIWELQNLGMGNRARLQERRAENQVALLEQFAMQDRIAAEVAQAYAQLQSAGARVKDAEDGLRDAQDSVEKNVEGLNQTRRVGEVILLIVRPQEAVAAVQSLALAYNDYYGAVADFDRAQFRLYRALGHPAHTVMRQPTIQSSTAPAMVPSTGR